MEKKSLQEQLFVYNANSGTRNAIMDSMHKVFSPKTYNCNLCDLTYGKVSENKEWKRFRKQNPNKMFFLHKDEFLKKYKSKFSYKFDFPIVLIAGDNGLEVLISTSELNQLEKAQELIQLVKRRT